MVLDTHIWIWWVYGDPALSKHAQKLIDSLPRLPGSS